MASPSTVLTRGYGSWGGVNLLPTLGYGIGAAIVPPPVVTPPPVTVGAGGFPLAIDPAEVREYRAGRKKRRDVELAIALLLLGD